MNLSIRNYVFWRATAMGSSSRIVWPVLLFRTDSHLSAVILTSPIDCVCTAKRSKKYSWIRKNKKHGSAEVDELLPLCLRWPFASRPLLAVQRCNRISSASSSSSISIFFPFWIFNFPFFAIQRRIQKTIDEHFSVWELFNWNVKKFQLSRCSSNKRLNPVGGLQTEFIANDIGTLPSASFQPSSPRYSALTLCIMNVNRFSHHMNTICTSKCVIRYYFYLFFICLNKFCDTMFSGNKKVVHIAYTRLKSVLSFNCISVGGHVNCQQQTPPHLFSERKDTRSS